MTILLQADYANDYRGWIENVGDTDTNAALAQVEVDVEGTTTSNLAALHGEVQALATPELLEGGTTQTVTRYTEQTLTNAQNTLSTLTDNLQSSAGEAIDLSAAIEQANRWITDHSQAVEFAFGEGGRQGEGGLEEQTNRLFADLANRLGFLGGVQKWLLPDASFVLRTTGVVVGGIGGGYLSRNRHWAFLPIGGLAGAAVGAVNPWVGFGLLGIPIGVRVLRWGGRGIAGLFGRRQAVNLPQPQERQPQERQPNMDAGGGEDDEPPDWLVEDREADPFTDDEEADTRFDNLDSLRGDWGPHSDGPFVGFESSTE